MTDPTEPTREGAATDGELDALLLAWGAHQRLGRADADELLADILGPTPVPAAAPAELPATWWAELSQQVAAAVVLATVRPDGSTLAAA
jgi:hypothetical protein